MGTAAMSGDGFEVLVQASALADPEWRPVFSGRAAFERRLLAEVDGVAEADVTRIGRLGWLNLLPLLAHPSSSRRDVPSLCEAVARLPAARLHRVLLGGERRQLLEIVGPDLVDRAAAGEDRARDRLRRVLGGNDVVVSATEHVLTTSSATLKAEVVATLARWRDTAAAEPQPWRDVTAAAKRLLARLGVVGYLERTAPGVTYRLGPDDDLALVVSPSVRPIVAVVDAVDVVVVAHPPAPDDQPGPCSGDRLVELARAVGDDTRQRMLALLAEQDRTAARLSELLGAPRTTLLHHLAILRAAGLVRIEVAPGRPTVYRLRGEGLTELAALARGLLAPE